MNSLRSTRMLVVVLLLTVNALVVAGNVPPQAAGKGGKLLQIEGQVTVNGTPAISGATVFSDSTITTAARSSAVVSLGKLGRIEVLPDTKMTLSFGDSDASVSMLDAGRVRISSSSNVDCEGYNERRTDNFNRQSAKRVPRRYELRQYVCGSEEGNCRAPRRQHRKTDRSRESGHCRHSAPRVHPRWLTTFFHRLHRYTN